MYKRQINLPILLKKKSILLLGPRQTGKSTLLGDVGLASETIRIDLTHSNSLREFSANPEKIRELLSTRTKTIIIDEAQKIPELFDEVQGLLDRNKELRVILSGSSARKLRRSGMNLLPGRIWLKRLFPLVYPEFGSAQIETRVIRGSLPGIVGSDDYREELKNYTGLYLDEEVRSEALTRNIGAFSRFLTTAALSNTEQINYTNIANDTGIKQNTVRGYFEILSDTLIAEILEPFRKTKTRKAVATPKLFFFDQGIVNALLDRFDISLKSELFGKAFEQIIYQELRAYLSYSSKDLPLTYWRTHSKQEVDFIVGDEIAIEVRGKSIISTKDEKGLVALKEELRFKRSIIVSLESRRRRTENGNEVIPVGEFLSELWSGEVI